MPATANLSVHSLTLWRLFTVDVVVFLLSLLQVVGVSVGVALAPLGPQAAAAASMLLCASVCQAGEDSHWVMTPQQDAQVVGGVRMALGGGGSAHAKTTNADTYT
jgi:hypothetical protein